MADAVRRSSARVTARRRVPQRAPRADQYYLPKRIDNSRLVRAADPRERSEQKMLVVISLLLGAAVLAGAYQRFANIRAGYRLEELKAQRDQLLEANRQLRLEEASLRDPERVDAIARNQLGLGLPGAGQVVHLENRVVEPDSAVMARAQVPVAGGSSGLEPNVSPSVKATIPAAGAALPTAVP